MGKELIIRSIVVGFNALQHKGKIINCWANASDSAEARQPLNLSQHEDEVVEVGGTLHTDMWDAQFKRKFDKPKEAKCLKDLLQIREDNRENINKSKNLGSALGFKWSMKKNTRHPCIIIFVDKKKKLEEISEEEWVPEVLEDKNGIWCLTDVVTGGESGRVEAEALPALSLGNETVVRDLNSGGIGLIGGIRLAFDIGDNEEGFGTAGIAVKSETGETGFLTNRHVTGDKKRTFYHPHLNDSRIGKNYKPAVYSADKCEFSKWYGIETGNAGAMVMSDYGFVKIDDSAKSKIRPGIYGIENLGPVKKIDLGTMDIIGRKVISVGANRGIQRGTITAYSYEWKLFGSSYYADLLITGEEKDFAFRGDSGKIIISDDDDHNPIALHWGGVKGQFGNEEGDGQNIWGKATELGKILDLSGLKLLD